MSSVLYDALRSLGPISFSDVPLDSLETYLKDSFHNAENIVDSVPPPSSGEDVPSSQPTFTKPNAATSATEMENTSKARGRIVSDRVQELRKGWGKPMKLSNKDNPLGTSVYKMAGNDRHGAWFARSSVHEGMGFEKWKKALQREFPEALAVQGGPGAGAIRGIGADRRLEEREVEGVGKLEVIQLSAQFPGPTAPREFVTLLLTSDNALSEEAKIDGQIPRHYMVLSKPVTHDDAPQRDGLVRGQYESVEMIREIPSKRSGNAQVNGDQQGLHEEIELNPVEWIMVTRSDPGGGLPRFLVERGTPSSICADAKKFLDWATGQERISAPNEDVDAQERTQRQKEADQDKEVDETCTKGKPVDAGAESDLPLSGGYMASISRAAQDAVATYGPTSIQQSLGLTNGDVESESESSSVSSDAKSFASAESRNEETPRGGTGPAESSESLGLPPASSSSPESSRSNLLRASSRASSFHDKELKKITSKRIQLDEKLAKWHEAESKRSTEHSAKEEAEQRKAKEKHDKQVRKQEEKYRKEIEKLEKHRDKEEKRLEEKRKKAAEKDEPSKIKRERDEWKQKAELREKENAILAKQVQALQMENAKLGAQLAQVQEGGGSRDDGGAGGSSGRGQTKGAVTDRVGLVGGQA